MAAPDWTNANGTNLWSDGLNWSTTPTKPQAGDTVTFTNTSVANCTVDEVTAEIASLTIGGTASGDYSGTITGSNKIQMTGNLLIEAGNTGTLDQNADIDIDGNLTATSSGTTVQLGSGTWRLGGSLSIRTIGTWTAETSTFIATGASKSWAANSLETFWNLTFQAGSSYSGAFARVGWRNDFVVDGNITLKGCTIRSGGTPTITVDGTLTATTAEDIGLVIPSTQTTLEIGGTGTFDATGFETTIGNNGNNNVVVTFAAGTALTFKGAFALSRTTFATSLTFANNTNNPDLAFCGDITQNITGGGTINWTKGSGNVVVNGTANQTIDLDFSGDIVEAFEVDKTAGDVTLSGPLDVVSFTGTSTGTGDFDPNGQTITTTGLCDWAAAFTFDGIGVDVMNGSDWQIGGNFTADGQDLAATVGWDLDVTGTAVASGAGDVDDCTAGGTEITATGWNDGGGNTNWNFGVAVAIMNQFQGSNVGADLFNGSLI